MSNQDQDMGLHVLLGHGRACSPNIPEELLRAAYAIQVNRQFEKDREIPLKEMQKLVEQQVTTGAEKGGGQ